MNSLSVVDARSTKSRYCAPSEVSVEESVLWLFQLLGLQHSLACGCITPNCLLLPMVTLLLSLIRTSVFGFRSHSGNPGWSHLKILNYICKDLIFQVRSHPQVLLHGPIHLSWGHHSTHQTALIEYFARLWEFIFRDHSFGNETKLVCLTRKAFTTTCFQEKCLRASRMLCDRHVYLDQC